MARTKTCKICGKTFETTKEFRTYCSEKCKIKGNRKRAKDHYDNNKGKMREKERRFAQENPIVFQSRKRTKRNFPLGKQCFFCGSKINLHRHHLIYRVPPQREDYITLCVLCHTKYHKIEELKSLIRSVERRA